MDQFNQRGGGGKGGYGRFPSLLPKTNFYLHFPHR